jgi:hypothetical protein
MSTSASGGPPAPSGDGQGSPWAHSSGFEGTPQVPAGRPPVPRGNSRTLLWVGIAGAGALVAGVVVILVLVTTGFFGGDGQRSGIGPFSPLPPKQSKPPLAQLCPPPSAEADGGEVVPAPDGPRILDADAGISYTQLGAPFKAWDQLPWRGGTLGVVFNQGYYFVTETYPEGDYLASVLSGKVPAAFGDSLSLDLECAGRQVSDDVRNAYYPEPNVKEQVRSERTTLGGRPAWVSTFHLSFRADGLKARGESVAVVLLDVGRQDAAVLYLSIPDTHKQFSKDIDRVIASVRPL